MIPVETDLHSAVLDLITILKNGPEELVLNYSDEVYPLDLDFVYEPDQRISDQKTVLEKTDAIPKKVVSRNLNYLCTDCPGKMYPVRQYARAGKKDILVLYFNGSVDGKAKPDRSDRYIFGSPEEDGLFSRMCEASGFVLSDFHFQEFPACHFASTGNLDTAWKSRTDNCIKYVKKTVQEKNIKYIIFTGVCAQMYFGKEMALQKFKTMEFFDPEIDGLNVSAMVLRSPAALLGMEKKRKNAKGSDHEEILAEEKQIKTTILNALKRISDEIN